ncbi:MucR family transcriptional regulator [Sphingomonas sp. 1P06PA]|uniref:MucR family transcriptional regulator n=1 Tax=Sphingomonas sp. 1P06PA TaxID=554121 RepID=UPI0039A7705F
MADRDYSANLIELATELTIAWLNNPNNRAPADDVPGFLQQMHATLGSLASGVTEGPAADDTQTYEPAVTARKSLASKSHIISMIDGKPYKTLRRHLSGHGLTPEQYRERYNLKADYPMVAEDYSAARREMAKSIGLGRKPGMTRGKKAEAGAGAKPAAAAKVAKPAPKRKLGIAQAKSAAKQHLGETGEN